METEAKELAKFLVNSLQTAPPSERVLVGLSGIPASGKSSLAELIVRNTNDILGNGAVLIGLDGWHLTRSQLDSFQDPQLAHDRRGAHWTFDATAYIDFVQLLRKAINANTQTIAAPSFDHSLKDPTPNAINIHPHHRIILIEGLYTLLSIHPWCAATELLHERWLIKVDLERAKERLVKRHIASGVAKDLDEAVWRAENNDVPNGHFILDNVLDPTRVIHSIDDPTIALL